MRRIDNLNATYKTEKVWFMSDPHLGDPRRDLLGRPMYVDNLEDFMMDNWNGVVGENDLVVVVGDWCVDAVFLQKTPLFNGKKILLRGNYDRLPDKDYMDAGFEDVFPEGEGLRTTIRSEDQSLNVHIVHYPSLCIPDVFNVCGHIHGCWRVQKNILNVGVDVHNYTPIDEDKIFFYHRAIREFYDQDVWVGNHPANIVHANRGKAGTYFESKFAGSLGK